MNIELNIENFLTKEHKELIKEKISKAIELIDPNKITKEIESQMKDYDYGSYIFDEMNFGSIAEILDKKIKESIFKTKQ